MRCVSTLIPLWLVETFCNSAGDVSLFTDIQWLHEQNPKGQLQNEILHFDLDAFIKVAIKCNYVHSITSGAFNSVLSTFYNWREIFEVVSVQSAKLFHH